VTDHAILDKVLGAGCSYGCNQGRIRAFPFTYGSLLTMDGQVRLYLGEGRFTDDPLPEDFFGCAGVAEIPRLQDVLQMIGQAGHRHHVSLTPGNYQEPMLEAFRKYLGYHVQSL
jgi:L-fucose isomerase-like protein